MEILKEKLTAYGANMNEAMERFIDDMELYESCLQSFVQDEGFENLRKNILAEDYEASFNDAHTLKGVAGNLALTPLYKVISELVEKLRAKEYTNLESYLNHVIEEKHKLDAII